MGAARIGIVTVKDDLHALTVARHLDEGWGVPAAVMEVDTLAGTDGLTWSAGLPGGRTPTRLRTAKAKPWTCGRCTASGGDGSITPSG